MLSPDQNKYGINFSLFEYSRYHSIIVWWALILPHDVVLCCSFNEDYMPHHIHIYIHWYCDRDKVKLHESSIYRIPTSNESQHFVWLFIQCVAIRTSGWNCIVVAWDFDKFRYMWCIRWNSPVKPKQNSTEQIMEDVNLFFFSFFPRSSDYETREEEEEGEKRET